jgi:hypothetical protein
MILPKCNNMVETLEPRALLAGVTLIAHGYQGTINGGVDAMADDIADRAGGNSAVSQFILRVAKNGGGNLHVASFAPEGGQSDFRSNGAAEIIIRLDWSTVSGGEFSTGEVASVVADFMLSDPSSASLPRIAELPLHLIGFSRGASLVSALAGDLGRAGVWVDHLTFLDPHPVDGRDDILNADFGDAPMRVFDNVAFADNYWRTDGNVNNTDFDGEFVTGTLDGNLNNSVQSSFIGSAHVSVLSYYDGTIDLDANTGGSGDPPIMSTWFNGSNPPRDETGFRFTRLVTGGGGGRPVEGHWDASGGSAPRIAITNHTGALWPNVTDVRVLGGRQFEAGQTIKLRYIRQDLDGDSNVRFLLDRDQNPYNDNFVRTLRATNLADVDDPTANRSDGSTNGADAGTYWVCARITDSDGHTRYAYSRSIKLTDSANRGTAPSASPRATSMFSDSRIDRDDPEKLDLLI